MGCALSLRTLPYAPLPTHSLYKLSRHTSPYTHPHTPPVPLSLQPSPHHTPPFTPLPHTYTHPPHPHSPTLPFLSAARTSTCTTPILPHTHTHPPHPHPHSPYFLPPQGHQLAQPRVRAKSGPRSLAQDEGGGLGGLAGCTGRLSFCTIVYETRPDQTQYTDTYLWRLY